MTILAKTIGFSLLLILAFTAVTYILPQMVEEAPVEEEMDLRAMTMDSFVAAGESLYAGKGTCNLCHNALGRAPDLMGLNAVQAAAERLSDPRYEGGANDPEGYLRESMLDPDIFVVKGFGTKGTRDAKSPMPAADKAPIELTQTEIDAIIAFLQAKDGNTITVTLPTSSLAAVAASDEVVPAEPAAAKDALEALDKFACRACHSLLETESPIGPNLNDVGVRLTMNEIRASIISPNAIVAEGYAPIMPDLSASMTVRELEMLVQFLSGQKG
jgi:cbb3-type cytochrome oxidase cytochrome c subunit